MSGEQKRAHIKCRGSDNFIIGRSSLRNLQILINLEYVVEVNNCFFVYDKVTNLWTAANSDYTYISIPDVIKNERLWNLLEYKPRLLLGGKKKKLRVPKNTFLLADDQIEDVIRHCAEQNYTFKELYEDLQEKMDLPAYILPD